VKVLAVGEGGVGDLGRGDGYKISIVNISCENPEIYFWNFLKIAV
jgi:hypothetical protein